MHCESIIVSPYRELGTGNWKDAIITVPGKCICIFIAELWIFPGAISATVSGMKASLLYVPSFRKLAEVPPFHLRTLMRRRSQTQIAMVPDLCAVLHFIMKRSITFHIRLYTPHTVIYVPIIVTILSSERGTSSVVTG